MVATHPMFFQDRIFVNLSFCIEDSLSRDALRSIADAWAACVGFAATDALQAKMFGDGFEPPIYFVGARWAEVMEQLPADPVNFWVSSHNLDIGFSMTDRTGSVPPLVLEFLVPSKQAADARATLQVLLSELVDEIDPSSA